jgi:hypothetical protein
LISRRLEERLSLCRRFWVVVLSGDCGFGPVIAYLVLVARFLSTAPPARMSAGVEAELAGVWVTLSSAGHGRRLRIGLSMGRRN